MEMFNDIYSFTTENISGYMNGMDLTGKKVVTVTGSFDHVLNAIFCGASKVLTFDSNPLTKYYMDLKLAGIENLSFDMFLKVFLYNTKYSFDYSIIRDLPMDSESKSFWLEQLSRHNNNGYDLKVSFLFHVNYFNPMDSLEHNMYLSKKNYKILKKRLKVAKIEYVNTSLQDLKLDRIYDYMFLSNISDYIDCMYDRDSLIRYRDLIYSFLEYAKVIYFAYLYDLGANGNKSDMYTIDKVREVFGRINVETFDSVFRDGAHKRDGVLILRK